MLQTLEPAPRQLNHPWCGLADSLGGSEQSAKLQHYSLESMNPDRQSVVAFAGQTDQEPIVLIHDIWDSLHVWLLPNEAHVRGLWLNDWQPDFVRLHPHSRKRSPFGTLPTLLGGAGLMRQLMNRQRSVVAYSYCDQHEPTPDLDDAIAQLHDIILDTMIRFGRNRVKLVAHGVGGLIAYLALRENSVVCSARQIARSVSRLVTMGTPWQHGDLSQALGEIDEMIDRNQPASELLSLICPGLFERESPLETLRSPMHAFAHLTDECHQRMPRYRLHDEFPSIACIAGTHPHYLSCELPITGKLEFPSPLAREPELQPGNGDMFVSVESALAGASDSSLLATVRSNHMNLPMTGHTHAQVLEMLDLPI